MDGNKKMALLGSAPIPKALLALGIPTMIVILLSVIFLEPILKQVGAIESVMPYAITYTRIYIVFRFFTPSSPSGCAAAWRCRS